MFSVVRLQNNEFPSIYVTNYETLFILITSYFHRIDKVMVSMISELNIRSVKVELSDLQGFQKCTYFNSTANNLFTVSKLNEVFFNVKTMDSLPLNHRNGQKRVGFIHVSMVLRHLSFPLCPYT